MQNRNISLRYLFFDYFGSLLAWFCFFIFRKQYIEKLYNFSLGLVWSDYRFWAGIVTIPFFWIFIYFINGFYFNPLYKSRLNEFIQTFWLTAIGSLVIFFVLLLDDSLNQDYRAYYKSLSALFTFQFILVYIPKLLITSRTTHRIHRRKIGFKTLLIGDGKKALKLYNELEKTKRSAGYFFKGYLSIESTPTIKIDGLNYLGQVGLLGEIIRELQIEEVIIAVEKKDLELIDELISKLQEFEVRIKLNADVNNILTGQVKMNSILHAALIEINFDRMPYWQKFVKRAFDVTVSLFFLILLSPLYLTLAILVKTSSKGPVFFKQERIGKKGKPFEIIKFRSMYVDSEKNGPQLSSDIDNRITPLGKFLRKSRMDEIPQFWNVLKGQMSIVGPRPERAYFINQIVERAPQYKYLYKIKPGITSWGQVKYGYAENVDEMIDRLNFDLIYLENRSLLVDLKIMIYTILVVLQGKGK